MRRSQPLLRITAVASSLALAGAYIAYEVGLLRPAVGQSVQVTQVQAPATQPASSGTLIAAERAMISSSKRRVLEQPAPTPTTRPRRFLPGSKSNVHSKEDQNILFGDGHVEFEPSKEPPTTQPRTVLPGSKSLFPMD
jgi:hypothetical protein